MTEIAVDVAGMAEALNVAPNTVRNLARAGTIPAFKVGRSWRFFPSKVIASLEKPVDTWAAPARRRRAA